MGRGNFKGDNIFYNNRWTSKKENVHIITKSDRESESSQNFNFF